MTEPRLVLRLDNPEIEALFHYMLATFEPWKASIDSETPTGPVTRVEREDWPGLVHGILSEVRAAYGDVFQEP